MPVIVRIFALYRRSMIMMLERHLGHFRLLRYFIIGSDHSPALLRFCNPYANAILFTYDD